HPAGAARPPALAADGDAGGRRRLPGAVPAAAGSDCRAGGAGRADRRVVEGGGRTHGGGEGSEGRSGQGRAAGPASAPPPAPGGGGEPGEGKRGWAPIPELSGLAQQKDKPNQSGSDPWMKAVERVALQVALELL